MKITEKEHNHLTEKEFLHRLLLHTCSCTSEQLSALCDDYPEFYQKCATYAEQEAAAYESLPEIEPAIWSRLCQKIRNIYGENAI